jgi:hypothetical protein
MKRILHGALICALIVVMSMALWPASVSAAGISIYVDDDFADDASRHMWDTIQEGIDDATDNAGDTVYVYAGTYNENVSISKAKLTLHGESASAVTVVAGNSSKPTIEILASTVTVRQLTIRGGNPGVSWRNTDRGTLENSDITDNTIGIYIYNLTNQTIQCNNIYGNSGDGIKVEYSTLKDVIRNDIYSNSNDGISLNSSTTKIVVARNESSGNDRYGIYVDSSSYDNDIYLNDFSGNTGGNGRSDRDPLDLDGFGGNNWQTPSSPDYGNYYEDYGGIGSYDLGTEYDYYPLASSHTNYTPATGDEPASCTPYQAPPDPPTPATQNPPSNLTAEAVLSDGETPTWHVELNWQDNSDDELGFRIQRKVEGDGTYSLIATVGAGVTSYKDSDVVGGNTYHYRVRAYSSGGNSPYSNEASAATSEGGGGCFIATAAYGSYLDGHVETLRNFRDSYMLTNPVGSALVSAYYKLSPPVADFIDDHPTLKPIVRAGLMPAVAMSTVALNTTSAEKIAIVGSLALVSVALAVWLSRRRGRGVIS